MTLTTLLFACGSPSLPTDTSSSDDTSSTSSEDSGSSSTGTTLALNEFMASNQSTTADESGAFPDWLELYNGTDAEIDLGGYFLSDALDNVQKHEIAAGLTIDAGGFLLFWADNDLDEGDNHVAFNIRRAGEDLVLTSPDGEQVDALTFTEQIGDISLARKTDGDGEWEIEAEPTPGASNG